MATDQEIRDAGLKYIPQQQYLLNPFELPEDQEPVTNSGIVATNAFTGGGGNDFSVYNPDPNSIVNREYDPRPNYEAYYQDTFGANAKDPLSNFTMTGDPATLARGDTGGQFYEPPPSKLEGLMNLIPYAGSFVRGARFLGDQISPFLPVNRRSILENQLSGKGVMVDNIGRIVQGEGAYDTAGNIMSGYNASKMTAKTFDDRIAMAREKMSDENKGARIAALEAAKADFLDAQKRTDKIYDFEEDEKEKNKKNTIVGRFLNKRKKQKEIELQKEIDAANLKAAQNARTAGGPSYRNIASGDMGSDGQTPGGRGGNVTTKGGDTYGGATRGGYNEAAEKTDFYAKGGRAGYFYGGRVNFKVGGRTDAESQYGADSVGSYDSSQNRSDREQSYGGNNKPPVSNDNRVVTTNFITKNPNLTVDYTDPKNYASLYSKIGFKNLVDNDDLTVEGNVTGEFGPIGYNTNFTDQGITGTNLTAGNFNANISPDMQVQNIAYNNNINGINYGVNTDFDNTMFTAGVNFKNGGLASIL